MADVLLCWLGDQDVKNAREDRDGAISAAAIATDYDRVLVLNDRPAEFAAPYIEWLRSKTNADVECRKVELEEPADHGRIYEVAAEVCEQEAAAGSSMTFHLSPGTGPMGAVWLLLGKTRFRGAKLLQSSPERGVLTANVPFDIALEVIPDLIRAPSRQLERDALERAPERAAFDSIIHRSPQMKRAIAEAHRFALWPFPVLIEGESGTGKELFARAIHDASSRRKRSFVPVNCGAIPKDLIEAELFGHERGAFTGADRPRSGFFEQADGGTLFLDELGELPMEAQVKLLRALESGEIRRVGATTTKTVDVRIVAATNRSLPEEVARGAFREDLFYRLVVGRMTLPPLRERTGDVGLLLDDALRQVNRDGLKNIPSYVEKTFSPAARSLLIQHPWLGNVRELRGTVRRAATWTDGAVVDERHVDGALLRFLRMNEQILDRPLGDDMDLREVLGEVARHYIGRALRTTGGGKTEAARLLGLPSYQTLTNWIKKYGVGD